MIADFLAPLIAVGVAELGDKTQLAVLLLSSKTQKHMRLLIGVMLAFLVVDGAAVLAGSWSANILPASLLKTLSGIVFIACGMFLMLKKCGNESGECETGVENPFLSGFALVFMTEWGDKTQIASGLFATKYSPLLVLAGTMTALTLLSATAIYLGRFAAGRVKEKTMTTIAGLIFILVGVSFFLFK